MCKARQIRRSHKREERVHIIVNVDMVKALEELVLDPFRNARIGTGDLGAGGDCAFLLRRQRVDPMFRNLDRILRALDTY